MRSRPGSEAQAPPQAGAVAKRKFKPNGSFFLSLRYINRGEKAKLLTNYAVTKFEVHSKNTGSTVEEHSKNKIRGSMKKLKREGMPYFRMYASVILADTNFNSLNEIQTGWYFRLMLETWFRAGFLPEDDETLRRLAGCRRRDSWEQHKGNVLFFFDQVQEGGQNVLVHAGLRKQWLSANEAYDKKIERKQLGKKKTITVPAQKALPPASERNILTDEEFARLVQKPVAQIRTMLLNGDIKRMGDGIHRDEARKLN